MKGVGFWFSLSLTGGEKEKNNNKKKKKLTSCSFWRHVILFTCHKCSRWIVGELSFQCITKSSHNILFIFITFSCYQLLIWACPKSHLNSLFSLVETLPSVYNYLILSSRASIKAPQLWSLTIQRDLPSSCRISHPPQKGNIWLVCGNEKAFPIPHNHCAASSECYSTSKSSQTAACRCNLLGAWL